jgi:hypothetical protein
MGGYKLDSAGSGWVSLASWCEHGNSRSGSLKGGEVIDKREYSQVHNEYSVPLN